MTQTPASFPLGGGVDLVSAALAVPAGRLVAALNYEPLAEGYGRVAGHERFDGRVPPSRAGFWAMPFDMGAVPIAQGVTVTGGTSGAIARVVLEPHAVTGDWDEATATGILVLAQLAGVFQPGEPLRVMGVTRARCAGVAAEDSAPAADLRRAWTIAVREDQRARVGKVPGTGPVRGVAIYRGGVYAWRDQDVSRAAMFRATTLGWIEMGASHTLPFAGGTVELDEGTPVHQGGSSAVVRRVVLRSGTYSGGDATGYLVVNGRNGGFAAGALLNAANATVAQLTGPDVKVRFDAGGRYDTIGHNFYGSADRYRLYGAYGAGPAFEFDGSVVAPIATGMADDRPTRVAELAQHLVLTFPGGSVQFAAPGEPLDWNPVVGAGEIGLGDEVTDVLQSAETAVVLFGRGKVAMLSGRDLDTFQLDELSEEAGAEPWTAQRIGTAVYLDRRGLRTLSATNAYGNFKTGTLTELVAPYLVAKRKAGVAPVLSLVCKTKGQYRLYWSDRTGLAVYMGRKQPEAIPFSLGDMQPFCGATGELDDGTEAMFVGAEDGYVYRLDSGPSFDGAGVQGFAMLPYNHLGSVMTNKRFHAVSLEMVAAPTTRIGLTCQFDYGDGTQPIDGSRDFTVAGGGREFAVQGGGGAWDVSTWNDFFWSAAFEGTASAPIDGFGRNISVLIGAQSDVLEEPHVLQAYHIHYSSRGMKRVG